MRSCCFLLGLTHLSRTSPGQRPARSIKLIEQTPDRRKITISLKNHRQRAGQEYFQ
jgi:hypothetical protein